MMRRKHVALLLTAILLVVAAGCAGQEAPEEDEPTSEPAGAQSEADYAVEVTASEETIALADGQTEADIVFTVTNTGQQADTYQLVTEAFGMLWNAEGIPQSVTLEPGDSEDIVIPMTFEVEGTITGFDVSLTANSEGDPEVTDTAACTVEF